MVKFDTESQKDKSSTQLPLPSSFFKVHPYWKESFFAVNEFKLSKNEDWLICNAMNNFSIILSVKSGQYDALIKLIDHCQENETALICQFSKDTKSGVIFGEDEEVTVKWEDTDDWYARYHFVTVNQYSTTPPSPNSPDDAVKRARRTGTAKPR